MDVTLHPFAMVVATENSSILKQLDRMADASVDLRQLSCSELGCSKDTPRLSNEQIKGHLARVVGWSLGDAFISKTFKCSTSDAAMQLVRKGNRSDC